MSIFRIKGHTSYAFDNEAAQVLSFGFVDPRPLAWYVYPNGSRRVSLYQNGKVQYVVESKIRSLLEEIAMTEKEIAQFTITNTQTRVKKQKTPVEKSTTPKKEVIAVEKEMPTTEKEKVVDIVKSTLRQLFAGRNDRPMRKDQLQAKLGKEKLEVILSKTNFLLEEKIGAFKFYHLNKEVC